MRHVLFLTVLLYGFGYVHGVWAADEWRRPDPGQTVYLETDEGRIVIELNPRFAPQTSAQFLRLVRSGFYDGLRFYRVIDGFVAQGGDGSDLSRDLKQPVLPAEFELTLEEKQETAAAVTRPPFVPVQSPDLFASATGFIDGFPAAHDAEGRHYWLTHCPAAVAMARDNAPDSGSTDFYIVIGQAPRYLDRNLTIFGRVIVGMEVAQRIRRGPADKNGIIDDSKRQTQIHKARVAADLAEKERLDIQIMETTGAAFQDVLRSRRHREHEFFHIRPPAVLDVCQIPVAVKIGASQ